MKIILYGNGSSKNHGCEAIVRGTQEVLNVSLMILSEKKEDDIKYDLDEICEVCNAKSENKNLFQTLKAYVKLKLFKDYTTMDVLPYIPEIKKQKNHIDYAFSVGGDNYCYSNQQFYASLNKLFRKNKIKTVLWGCSVEPMIMRNKKIVEDLKSYHLIVARESITFEALKEIGANVVLAPDPAFFMKMEKCKIDERVKKGNIVGINISPMIISNENVKGMTYSNYKNLISYILEKTDMDIALIPHVVWDSNDDRYVLQQLYEDFSSNKRIIMVSDMRAPELKYVISKCRFFIGARTHATIAAYSTCVPTLVVGYSVKARGIAKDLFGTVENYVLPVQSLSNETQLTDKFCWLCDNEEMIRQSLIKKIPEYIENGYKLKKILEKL